MIIPLDDLLNRSSGFGQNCNFLLLAIFSNVPFHVVFVVASNTKLIPDLSFYCSHFEWPEIWDADVSWLLSELIIFWSSSVDFALFGSILTWWNRSNLSFLGIILKMQGKNGRNLACWCIQTTFRNYYILVTVCWFSSLWCHFDLVKQVKSVVSGDFLQNTWEKWPKIWHADVSWSPLELSIYLSWSVLSLTFLVTS